MSLSSNYWPMFLVMFITLVYLIYADCGKRKREVHTYTPIIIHADTSHVSKRGPLYIASY